MPRDKNAYRPWRGCPNANYCGSVCQAWNLPLIEVPTYSPESGSGSFFKVKLTYNYPHNYKNATWKNYMKGYGYAEAVELPYQWWNGFLEVQRNIPKSGFAEAVPLKFDETGTIIPNYFNQFAQYCRDIPTYPQDADGFWWHGDRRSLKQVLKR